MEHRLSIKKLIRYGKHKIFTLQVAWARRRVDIFEAGIIREFMRNDKEHSVIDVRSEDLWKKAHIPGAICIPYDLISKKFPKLDLERDDLIVVYCQNGDCSAIAACKLKKMGYRVVSSLEGGFPSWDKEGFDITKR